MRAGGRMSIERCSFTSHSRAARLNVRMSICKRAFPRPHRLALPCDRPSPSRRFLPVYGPWARCRDRALLRPPAPPAGRSGQAAYVRQEGRKCSVERCFPEWSPPPRSLVRRSLDAAPVRRAHRSPPPRSTQRTRPSLRRRVPTRRCRHTVPRLRPRISIRSRHSRHTLPRLRRPSRPPKAVLAGLP